jgi:glycosyltransferase involved in cell wall biosynthesis
MRVGIDARFALRAPIRGIGTYSLHLINNLVTSTSEVEFLLYIDRENHGNTLPSGPNVFVRRLTPSIYPVWEQLSLPLALKRDKVDIFHSLGNTAPFLLPNSIKLIATIHDVIYLKSGWRIPRLRNLYQWAGGIYRALIVPKIARRAECLVTISEFSRRDILCTIKYLDECRVVTIYEDCSPEFKSEASISSPLCTRPFLLCLGAEDPRKNTFLTVKAYINALRRGSIQHDLVVCGYENWSGSEVHRLVQREGASDKVKFLPFVSVPNLIGLYRQATALLYFSRYEGFGIPLLEAFSCGCPVLASKATSIPEVGGDAPIYVDSSNIEELEDAIVLLCNDLRLQSELRARGLERARSFSWARAAAETVSVYKRVFSPTN